MPDTKFLVTPPEMAERLATVNYVGGSITATRGVFQQMFGSAAGLGVCDAVIQERKTRTHVRTDFVGAPVKTVAEANWTYKKFPSQAKSQAAGGEAIKVRIVGEWWGARLTGSHSSFMEFLCDQAANANIVGTIAWKSERGTFYGPVSST